MAKKSGWNDLDASEVGGATRLSESQKWSADSQQAISTQEEIARATKELTEKIGIGGSLGNVRSGGVVVGPGLGVSTVLGGTRKSAIEPDGDVFFGSDLDTPAGTSFITFANEQNYNDEVMEPGDVLIGDNSDDSSNVKWDASEAQFQFRYGKKVNAYLDADGIFGNDALEINDNGLDTLNAAYAIRLRTQGFPTSVGEIIDSYISQHSNTLRLETFQDGGGGPLLDIDFETGDLDGGTATDPSSKISVVKDEANNNYYCEFADTSDHTTEYIEWDHALPTGISNGVFVEFRAYGTGTIWFGETGGAWLYSINVDSLNWRRYVVPLSAVADMAGLMIGVDASYGAVKIDNIRDYHNYSADPHALVRVGPNLIQIDGAVTINDLEQNTDVVIKDVDGDEILRVDVDGYDLLHYGQPLTTLEAQGWSPFAYPLSFNPSAALTTALSLPASGGCIAVPMWVPSRMKLYSVSVLNTNTATQRNWNWGLYRQASTENSLERVAYANTQAFTPTAVSIRTLAASGAPAYINPGLYWLVVKNASPTAVFGLGSTAASAAFDLNAAQTKTLVDVNPPSDPLDFTAATWTKVTAMYAVRLNGAVFGESTVF